MMWEYIIESVLERLHQEGEERELSSLTVHLDQDPILKKLWNNEKDASYDRI